MSIKDCKARVAAAMGEASEEEVVAALKDAASIINENKNLTPEDVANKIDELLTEVAITKKIEVRNKAINTLSKVMLRQHVDKFPDATDGFESFLMGINTLIEDGKGGILPSRDSLASLQESLREGYLTTYINDLDALGRDTFDLFREGDIDDEIIQALWVVDSPELLEGMSPQAIEIAKVIDKALETTRLDANSAGAMIKKNPSYVGKQTHDMDRIRAVDQEDWIKEIYPLLYERTFDGVADKKDFLRNVHKNLKTGIHHGSGSVMPNGIGRNVAKSVSQERILHFKDADSYIQYNKKYGRGGLSDNIMSNLRMSAQNTAMMRKLGLNPEANLNEVINDKLKELTKTDSDQAERLQGAKNGKFKNYYAQLSGATSIPANKMGASIGQVTRGLISIKALGKVVVSALPDTGFTGSELKHQGMNLLSSYATAFSNAGGAIGDLGKSMLKMRLDPLTPEKRRVLAELEISLDSMTGGFRSRFDASGDPYNPRISEAMRQFFRLNGLTLWTDSMRGGAVIGMARHVGDFVSKSWKELPEGLRDTIGLYGINGPEWKLINKAGTQTFEGVDGKFLTPESVLDLDDAAIASYLSEVGLKPTKTQIDKTRAELKDKIRTYYVDRTSYAVIEPDAKTMATMHQGTQAGSFVGELMRFLTHFKGFPFALMQKVYGRDVLGQRNKGKAAAVKSVEALSQLFVINTLLGYVAMSIKDITNNREPRDPMALKTWTAAALQGGGLGIMGDFLFGEAISRFGSGAFSSATGPLFSEGDMIARAIHKVATGDEKALATVFKLSYSYAPSVASMYFPPASILNTVYAKAAMDNLILYNTMEALDSGYKRRMEKRIKRENDQELLFK